jgi:hypothetical protein
MTMLHLLDESLEVFLRATVPLPRREVDVSFEAPDRDWAAKVSRPTINLYLWDVRRNISDRDFGVVTVHDEHGKPHRRPPLPRIDCRYLVTAWTTDIRDEHSLLGATLAALLVHPELDKQHLQGAYASVIPVPSLEVGAGDGRDNSDFWSALGGQLKPGLDLTVTATVDSALLAAAGPPVDRYILKSAYTDGTGANQRQLVAGHAEPGSVVSTPHGATEVDESGTFLVAAEAGDEISVNGVPNGQIPDTGPIDC